MTSRKLSRLIARNFKKSVAILSWNNNSKYSDTNNIKTQKLGK